MKQADMNTGFMSLSPGVGQPSTSDNQGVQTHPILHSVKRTLVGSLDDVAMFTARALKRLPKEAQAAVPTGADPTDKPSHEEYNLRKEKMRKLLGAAIGGGYGSVAGGMLGGTTFGNGRGFDKQTAVKGMILGALGGGAAGLTAGSVLNHIRRYTGENHAPAQSTIQIVVPPSPEIMQQVTDAIKSGSAVAATVGIFAGMKQADMNPMKGEMPSPGTPIAPKIAPPPLPTIDRSTLKQTAPKATAGAPKLGPNNTGVQALLGRPSGLT